MSVEAISWALTLAPDPADRGGQPSSACEFVLVGLANHAGPDGTGAFSSVATLVRYTGLSERTAELPGPARSVGCHPALQPGHRARADEKGRPAPKGWDLDLSRIRGDLADMDVAVLGRQFPGRAARPTAVTWHRREGSLDGVQSPHPASGAVDNLADGVQPWQKIPNSGPMSVAATGEGYLRMALPPIPDELPFTRPEPLRRRTSDIPEASPHRCHHGFTPTGGHSSAVNPKRSSPSLPPSRKVKRSGRARSWDRP